VKVSKIAVVIPGYNHAAYIGPAIASVLAQDWPDLELLVLDDGSADDTAGAAERAVAGQRRVPARIERQANQGSARTLNRLIERSDADYVAILNSDDLYAPGRLRALVERAAGQDLFFGFTGMSFLESGATQDFGLFEDWYRSKFHYAAQLPSCGFALLGANITITSSNFLFSRELFDLVGGFDPALPLTQDWAFAVDALRWTEPVLLPRRLMSYRVHPGNTWRRLQDLRRAQSVRVLERFAAWAAGSCLNPLAPTPGNWPAFFPFFVRVCGTLFSDDPVGGFLPPGLLSLDRTNPAAPRDLAAIARLLAAARQPAGEVIDTAEALGLAARHWEALRAGP
jgi:glycosyltransferase involved in cell wall biosynthesis